MPQQKIPETPPSFARQASNLRGRRIVIALVTLLASIGTWTFASTSVHAAPSLLDQCVSSINDPVFTKAFILTQTGFADEAALLAAVASNSWTIQIANGPSWTPTLRGMSPDIYCGDANDNYIQFLDSNPSGSHDFFFGGAGNDTVDSMWDSLFWGGEGNDTINHNRERSIFYGGPGNNTCSDRESTGSYIATCDNNGGPTIAQAALSITDNTMNVNATLTLSTTGGSGGGALTYSLVSAGSASCSLSGAVLTPSSSGTCTVSATKAGDGTYSSISTGTVTITVSKLAQASLSFAATATVFGTNLTLATSGGSGTGAVTYSLVSAGSASCSLSGAVLSTSSVGSCTVSASKASDSTYNSATTGAITITVTAVPTTTTIAPTTTTTAAPALEIVVNAPVKNSGQSAQPTIAPTKSTTTTVAKSQTTVAPAVTTTTVAATTTTTLAPVAPAIAPVTPGNAAVTVGDTAQAVTVQRADNQVTVSAGDISATVGRINKSGDVAPLDADGNVRLQSGDTVRITLAGFDPSSVVEAWLFSTPQLMGTAKVGADGTVVGTFKIPKNVPTGSHRIAVVAQTTDGKPATLAFGVMVGNWKKERSITLWLIVIPIVLAVLGALTLPATRRRRKSA